MGYRYEYNLANDKIRQDYIRGQNMSPSNIFDTHDCAHEIVQASNVGPFRNGKRTSPSPPRELQDLSFFFLQALLALPLAPASFTAGFHTPRNP